MRSIRRLRRRRSMTEFTQTVTPPNKTLLFKDLDEGDVFVSKAGIIGTKRGPDWATYLPDPNDKVNWGRFIADVSGVSRYMEVQKVASVSVTVVLA